MRPSGGTRGVCRTPGDGRNVAVRRVEVRNDLLQDGVCLYTTSGLSDPSQV